MPRLIQNFFRKPATRMFPVECRIAYDLARGKVEFDVGDCKFCGNCAKVCPTNAIEVSRQEKSVTFEPFRCISCGACIDVCRFGSVLMSSDFRCPAYDKPTEVHVKPPKVSQPVPGSLEDPVNGS